MEKLAIITISIGDRPWSKYTIPTMEHYARVCRADFRGTLSHRGRAAHAGAAAEAGGATKLLMRQNRSFPGNI